MLAERMETLLGQAWAEVKGDQAHHLGLMTRLSIYDLLLDLPDGSLYEHLVLHRERRLPATGQLRKYYLLGLLTVIYILPVWERDMNKLLESEPEYQEYGPLYLPYTILRSAYMLYMGNTMAEVEEMIASTDKLTGSTGSFHIMFGNLYEELWYPQSMVIGAAYDVFGTLADRTGPITLSKFGEYPADIKAVLRYIDNCDFAYHACEAFTTYDPNPPGWNKSLGLPIERDPRKALEFWRWWLFEAVPQANRLETGVFQSVRWPE